jgi:hypothetical protein
MYGLDPVTFSRPDGSTYTATYPPLNGIFANEPFSGSEKNCEAIYPVELTQLADLNSATFSEAAVLSRPLLYLRSTKSIEEDDAISWCYGNEYTRDYTTSCVHEVEDEGEGVSIPENVMDAIFVLFLLDVTGRLGALTQMKIPSPAELLQYHMITSTSCDPPSFTIPQMVEYEEAPSTTSINLHI